MDSSIDRTNKGFYREMFNHIISKNQKSDDTIETLEAANVTYVKKIEADNILRAHIELLEEK
jgi:hypothetical protein